MRQVLFPSPTRKSPSSPSHFAVSHGMKLPFRTIRKTGRPAILAPGLALSAGWSGLAGTALDINYQGRLQHGQQTANGNYDLRLTPHTAQAGGNSVGGLAIRPAISVQEGVFAVPLGFDAGAFDGEERWLEIAVRAAGSGERSVVRPRQPVTPARYALYARPPAGPQGIPRLRHCRSGRIADQQPHLAHCSSFSVNTPTRLMVWTGTAN